MTGFRKHVCLTLCLLYLGSLLIPAFLPCPCHADRPVNQPVNQPQKEADCCRAKAVTACCDAAESAVAVAPSTPSDKNVSECCSSGGQCMHCAQCYSANQYLPVHEQVNANPELNPAFIDSLSPLISVDNDAMGAIDHPPDRARIAAHIASTVLLC